MDGVAVADGSVGECGLTSGALSVFSAWSQRLAKVLVSAGNLPMRARNDPPSQWLTEVLVSAG